MPDAPGSDHMERRTATELRASAGRKLEGYAATFGVPARIGGFTETILPGAFRASLAAGRDVLCLVDHDPSRLLGRTASGTLRLAEDSRGLHFELDMPDTGLGRDVLALAERRDLGGMSFSFKATDEAWPARDRRELRALDLFEVSVVHSHPAYQQTVISVRSRPVSQDDTARRIRRLMVELL